MTKWDLTIKNGFRTWGSFEITVLIQRVQETAVWLYVFFSINMRLSRSYCLVYPLVN